MKHNLIIASEQIRNRAELIVSGLPVDGSIEVVVRPYKVNRSALQNSFYWRIITIIGNEIGNTKDEQHDIYKGMFLIPIFVRDDPGFAEMWTTINNSGKERKMLIKEVLKLTSTTQASVKQMAEYLDDCCHHAAVLGIRLPAPEDR